MGSLSDNVTWLHHRSPGVTAIYNELKSSRKNRILDLGSSSGASFNFFAHLSCHIHFENLGEFFELTDISNLGSEQVIEHLNNYLSPFNQNEKFDVVLTWDIFDYLDLPVISWLIERLSLSFTPNTLLHSVRSVSKHISPTPKAFQIVDQYQINIASVTDLQVRKYPCHHTAKLLKYLPHCYMENSYLNFEGMVPSLTETVMRYEPDKPVLVRRQASDELAHGKHANDQHNTLKLTHRSYALEPIFSKLSSEACILDVGLKNKNNLDFLYDRTRNIFAENIVHTLGVPQNRNSNGHLKPHILNFPEGTVFDTILFWDILNFLDTDATALLFERLSPYIAANTEIHVILYSGSTTPCQPQQFQIKTEQLIEILAVPKVEMHSTLTSSGLLKAIKHFQLRDTYVFRDGMQRGIYEYVLTRRASYTWSVSHDDDKAKIES